MNTINKTYKLYKKSEYEYQIKEGRRILEKLTRVKDGWSSGTTIYPSLGEAIEQAIQFRKNMLGAFGAKVNIDLVR